MSDTSTHMYLHLTNISILHTMKFDLNKHGQISQRTSFNFGT